MKFKTSLIFLPLVCLLSPRPAPAQCPQTCGDGSNTSFGVAVTTGVENTVVGTQGLLLNVNGGQNTVVGAFAGFGIMGGGNTAIGDKTLNNNFAADDNTAVGYAALSYCGGSNNIGIGVVGGTKVTSGNDNIEIGNQGTADDNRVIRLGNIRTQRSTYIAGIAGVTVPNGVAVMIDNDGHLGTITSSARFKDDIQPMKNASAAILSLQPVTFRYKKELDSARVPQYGLVAEDVAKVDPDLVVKDDAGKPFTVRYEAVNAMLLNEFLKEHREVQAQREKIASLEKREAQSQLAVAESKSALQTQGDQFRKSVAGLKSALQEQAAQLRKVSAQAQDAPRLAQTRE